MKNTDRRDGNAKVAQRRSRKRNNPVKILGAVLAVLLLAAIGVYASGMFYYKSHFLRGTEINGIDVSGMTIEELEDTIRSYELAVKQRGKGENEVYLEKISGKDINIQIVSDGGLEEIMDGQSLFRWFEASGESYSKETLISYDETLLAEKIAALKGLNKEYVEKPESAYISEYNAQTGYEIIPEKQGNFLNKQKVVAAVNAAVADLESEIDLDAADCYRKPKKDSGDKKLNALLTKLNQMVSVRITYHFDGTEEVVDGRNVSEWMIVDGNKVSLNEEKVAEYVATLRRKYDTIFRDRTFKTSYGKTVTIEGGDYGWWMNYTKETEELIAQIQEGKSGERTPVYYQTAAKYGKQDYGDSYVEINLTAQHLFVYQNGKKVMESDFVSGNSSRNMATPAGVYGITYKERYAVLVGETYESTVSYWMPFNGDIGMHDAIWKTQFGSAFYKTDGSHGCINLPYNVAKKIYSLIEKGTAVICYHLNGTESDSVTVQSYEEIAQAAIEAIDAIGTVTKNSKDAIKDARYMYDKVGANARQYVKNYNVLTEAEAAFRALSSNQ